MSFYVSPTVIDVLLVSIYVMLALTLALTGWSVLRTMQFRKKGNKDQGIPARTIGWGVAATLICALAITWMLADTTPIIINGKAYDNVFWLRISDMLIYTSAVLIVLAVGSIVAGIIWTRHR
jgi:hypothetical protein